MQCCTSSRPAASGVCFPLDFPSGARCIRTLPKGLSPARTASAFWSGLKKISWRGSSQTGTQRHDQLLDR
jgi:hypothetical protein